MACGLRLLLEPSMYGPPKGPRVGGGGRRAGDTSDEKRGGMERRQGLNKPERGGSLYYGFENEEIGTVYMNMDSGVNFAHSRTHYIYFENYATTFYNEVLKQLIIYFMASAPSSRPSRRCVSRVCVCVCERVFFCDQNKNNTVGGGHGRNTFVLLLMAIMINLFYYYVCLRIFIEHSRFAKPFLLLLLLFNTLKCGAHLIYGH